MSDLSLAIIIAVAIVMAAPVWVPFLYFTAMLIIGTAAFVLGMVIYLIVVTIDGIGKVLCKQRAS